MNHLVLAIAIAIAIPAASGAAQAQTKAEAGAAKSSRPEIPAVIEYPKHRGLIIANVDGQPVRLEDLAQHLRAHYDPGILERWSGPGGKNELNVRNLPMLLYQYVDTLCLWAEVKARPQIKVANFEKLVDRLLREDFVKFLAARKKRMKGPLTDEGKAFLRARHRRERGLAMEVQALLDLLRPGLYRTSTLRAFHQQHGDFFGGKVQFAHILFANRDPATGRLYPEARQLAIRSKIRRVQIALQKDPGLFQKLAAKYSDDKVTAPKGGEVGWVSRFSKALPAALVRAAWRLPEGGYTKQPVETFYGLHIVRRIRFVQNHYILFYGKTYSKVADGKQAIDQENLLFDIRKRHKRLLFL